MKHHSCLSARPVTGRLVALLRPLVSCQEQQKISCFPVSVQVFLLEEITCLITADDTDVLSQRGFFNNGSVFFPFSLTERWNKSGRDFMSVTVTTGQFLLNYYVIYFQMKIENRSCITSLPLLRRSEEDDRATFRLLGLLEKVKLFL